MPPPLSLSDINKRLSKECKLTVLQFVSPVKYRNVWIRRILVRCICGRERTMRVHSLVTLQRTLCGQCHENRRSNKKYKYSSQGKYRKLYNQWYNMLDRCYDQNNTMYRWYGGKGVTVCKKWKDSFDAFAGWAIKNGWKEGLQVDKDIKGNGMLYSPRTCLLVTKEANNRFPKNLVSRKNFTYKGERVTVSEVCRRENIKLDVMRNILDLYDISLDEAVKYQKIRQAARDYLLSLIKDRPELVKKVASRRTYF